MAWTERTSTLDPVTSDAAAWLVGGGSMGELVRSVDWSGTALGPIESWPQSLRTAVGLCLASNFPISLVWGPHHEQIYNDGYWPICGGKHPYSMGQDFTECWASAWPVIGESFERALTGETSYLENQRMFLDRNGYLEEAFFTFSFSPIRDESGGVGGLFHPVTETTAKMLSERRTRALRELGAQASSAKTAAAAFELAARTIVDFSLDIPFALFYWLESGTERATLIAHTRDLPSALAVATLNVTDPSGTTWPLAEVAHNGAIVEVELRKRFGDFSCAPYPEAPKTALLMAITPPGFARPAAILIAGRSSRSALTEEYRTFLDLVAAAVTAALANALAHEEERRRAEALAEIDRAKTAFFSNVSHEFRTPLTLMLGPLEDELAETVAPLPQDRRTRLETAHRNTLRLLKLVNALLDFSRIEAGRMHASYEATDLAAYTAELASVFRSAIEKADLRLSIDCPPLPGPVYVDRDMWEKIVLNLVSNAFKHTFTGGIRVTLHWLGEYVELRVIDTGVGIAPADLPHLFDRFHRVKGAKSRTHEGTGIGLALVQELTHFHGGAARVQSQENEGSVFSVSIKTGTGHLAADRIGAPRSIEMTAGRPTAFAAEASQWLTVAAPDARDLPHSPGQAEPAPETRPRILWADDNADMREYVRRLLAERYDVTSVSDGKAAVAAALAERPDLVLTDVMMPGLDGFGVLHALRSDERTRTIPVILLSARAGEEASIEGLDAGADDYLVKPFSARDLLARVRTNLEMSRLRREWHSELELRVKERTAELAQLHEHLQNAYDELRETQLAMAQQERLRALGQMASGIAHDINNAVSPVMLYVETLLEHESTLSERARSYLVIVRRAINDVASTVARMRQFYRPREPQVTLAPIDLNVLVDQVIALTRARWSDISQQRGIVIEMAKDLAPTLASIQGIESEIRDALINLIFNAVDAMPDGGMLTLRTRQLRAPERVCLEVVDTGLGMDEATRAKCIEPFFTTKGERGTGLGLSMVYGMSQRHGAELELESLPARGTTVRLTFVIATPTAAAVFGSAAPFKPPASPLRILAIDDDPLVLAAIGTLLENEGHAVTSYSDARAGLDAFKIALEQGRGFPVVITDLGMPYVDGKVVARTVKAAAPGTLVILLTGWGQGGTADGNDLTAVDRVLGKPPRLEELRAALALASERDPQHP